MTTFAQAASGPVSSSSSSTPAKATSPALMAQGTIAAATAAQPSQQHANSGANGTSNGIGSNGSVRSSQTSHGFVPPPKGYFSPTPTKTTTAINRGFPTAATSPPTTGGSSAVASNGDVNNAAANGTDNRSTVSRPRRESIGQMRRKQSDSATAAASAGGIGIAFAPGRSQPIPNNRSVSRAISSTSPRFGADGSNGTPFSTSLGSAAEALSLPASVLNSGAKSGRSTGHTHFGKECFGPEPGEEIPNPPSSLIKGSSTSEADSTAGGDDDDGLSKSAANGKELPIHRCESCSKIYRHPSCLIKHRWEHTSHWKEASKFLMSKHQQVQLLEAAAILVNLDGDAASLPDEKALWPAAVSPATSGLLGSDKVNFDKLMERKVARRGRASSTATESVADSSFDVGSPSSTTTATTNNGGADSSPALARSYSAASSSMPRSPSAGMSPLNSFSRLGLSSTPVARRPSNASHPHSYSSASGAAGSYSLPYSSSLSHHHASSRFTSDFHHYTLDESDERTTTSSTDKSPTSAARGQDHHQQHPSASFRNAGRISNGFGIRPMVSSTSSEQTKGSMVVKATGTPATTNGSGTSGSSSSGGASVSGGRSGSADTTDDDDDDILMVGGVPNVHDDDDEEEDDVDDDEDLELEEGSLSGVSVTDSAKNSSVSHQSSSGRSTRSSEKKWGLHEDAVAEMDMEE